MLHDSVLDLQAGAEPDIFIWGVTGGASFATRGAVNGLCRTFRKRPAERDLILGGHWGVKQNFGGEVAPLAPPRSAPVYRGEKAVEVVRKVARVKFVHDFT